jgi:hypothetical protein
MNLEDLKKPFSAKDIEWRVQQSGKKQDGEIWAMCLAYVTNRAIMDRLDAVCGPENWKNDFIPAPEGGVLCGLSIKLGDDWVTKWDGASNTDIESVKGGLSNAMKRSAVQWGIGRYLYDLDVGWANIDEKGRFSAKTKDNTWFKWNPPQLPAWALPDGEKPEQKKPAPPAQKTLAEWEKEATAVCVNPKEMAGWRTRNGKEIYATLNEEEQGKLKEHLAKIDLSFNQMTCPDGAKSNLYKCHYECDKKADCPVLIATEALK